MSKRRSVMGELTIHHVFGKIILRNADDVAVAEVFGSGHGDAVEYAKLFQSAPKLYAACRSMREKWGSNLTEPMRLINEALADDLE